MTGFAWIEVWDLGVVDFCGDRRAEDCGLDWFRLEGLE